MSPTLPNDLLARLGEFVAAETGLHFPPERWRDLERGLSAAARELGFEAAEACGRWLLSSGPARDRLDVLARHLTVGETYFFRDAPAFEALETRVLPDLIAARRAGERRLRLWSAGCCTGEEAYSLAILLARLLPDGRDWSITILGTDLNPRSVRRAAEGVYGAWSFRNTPEALRRDFFRETADGRWEVLPSVKRRVTFAVLNLAADSYPSPRTNTHAMDLILCRNVLMYFAPEPARRVVERLGRSLVDGGWLLVSPSEGSSSPFAQLSSVPFPGAVFFRKGERRAPSGGTPATGQADRPPPLGVGGDARRPVALSGMPSFPPGPPAAPAGREPSTVAPARSSETAPHDSLRDAAAACERGDHAGAAEACAAWLSAHPGDARAMGLLARVHANRGGLSEALEWCRRAIAADKLNPAHHHLCAVVLEERGEFVAAVQSLDRAVYLDPDFVLAHVALAHLAGRLGRPRDADRHRRNALACLARLRPDDVVPESEGMTAGRLAEIVRSAPPPEA